MEIVEEKMGRVISRAHSQQLMVCDDLRDGAIRFHHRKTFGDGSWGRFAVDRMPARPVAEKEMPFFGSVRALDIEIFGFEVKEGGFVDYGDYREA